jgi:hypothetical protein
MDINTRPNPGGCAPLPDQRSIPSLADIESSGPDERSANDASQTAADGDVSDTDEWFKEMNKKRKLLRYIEMDFNDPDIGVEGPSETYARIHKEYHPGVDIARE